MLLQLSYFPLHSTPSCPPHISCPWVIHISSLASTFSILFLTSLCLFSTYHLCFPHLYNGFNNIGIGLGQEPIDYLCSYGLELSAQKLLVFRSSLTLWLFSGSIYYFLWQQQEIVDGKVSNPQSAKYKGAPNPLPPRIYL